jgi:hypothetical protein
VRTAVFATPDVGRLFMICHVCHRVVPSWRLVGHAKQMPHLGCVCGCQHVRPARIPEVQAAYWVLVRGLLIRRLLGRKRQQSEWDPRLPWRTGAPGMAL